MWEYILRLRVLLCLLQDPRPIIMLQISHADGRSGTYQAEDTNFEWRTITPLNSCAASMPEKAPKQSWDQLCRHSSFYIQSTFNWTFSSTIKYLDWYCRVISDPKRCVKGSLFYLSRVPEINQSSYLCCCMIIWEPQGHAMCTAIHGSAIWQIFSPAYWLHHQQPSWPTLHLTQPVNTSNTWLRYTKPTFGHG